MAHKKDWELVLPLNCQANFLKSKSSLRNTREILSFKLAMFL